MGNIARIFLDWTRPLVETAAERLHGMARGGFPADFSHLLVVVPTAEASRQLRLRVAELCADRGGAVNLRIVQPDFLLGVGETAGPEQILAAWRKTLLAAADDENDNCSELFRNDVLKNFRDSDDILFGWGEALQNARTTLAREGLALADVAAKLDALCLKSASEAGESQYQRFSEFADLEKSYLEALKGFAGKLPDPAAAMLAAVRDPHLPEGVEKVVLIDCADLPGAPERFLENARADVECWINAPEACRERFDGFGRPRPECWSDEPIELDFETQLRLVPRPDQQAKKIFGILAGTAPADRPGAVGVLDPEVASALETRAELAGDALTGDSPRIFVPREIPFAELPWSRLLLAVIRLIDDDSVAAAEALWREPLAADHFRKVLRVFDPVPALELLDQWRQAHFVADAEFLDELLSRKNDMTDRQKRAAADLEKLSGTWKAWRAELKNAHCPLKKAYEIFAAIGGANRLEHLDFQRSEAEVSALRGIVAAVVALSGVPDASLVALLKRLLGSRAPKFRDEPQDAIAAVGFLELPWRSEKTLLIAGFNEGNLSPAGSDDLFLPDGARAALGMITREKRHAADILRFKALSLSHRLFILCGQQSQSGERLFPARLLFQCAADELPKRVNAVFVGGALIDDPVSPPIAAPPFSPRIKAPEKMSITGFSAYLENPFKFYLERVLGVRNCDPDASEMDNLAFGTFAHEVLQEFKTLQGLPEPQLKEQLLQLLPKVKLKNFGPRLPGLVELQCAMLEDQLYYFAGVQCREYASGWRIVDTERLTRFKWSELFDKVFPGEPTEWRDKVILSGKIDRIDRKDDDGTITVRVLDYKTSAKAKKPKDAHVVGKYPDWADEEACLAAGCEVGRNHRQGYWKDLQLPLYVLIVRHLLADELGLPTDGRICAGYFNLPLDLTSTDVAMFEELGNDETLESAVRCADWILRRIFDDEDGDRWEKFVPRASEQTLELFPGCAVALANFRAPGWWGRRKEELS